MLQISNPANLATHLSSRSGSMALKPIVDAIGTTASYDSCFVVRKADILARGTEYTLSVEFK